MCGCRCSYATVHVESENNLWESVLCCLLVGSMDKARVIKHACQCHYLWRRLSHLSLKYFLVILLITVALRWVFASFKSSTFFFFFEVKGRMLFFHLFLPCMANKADYSGCRLYLLTFAQRKGRSNRRTGWDCMLNCALLFVLLWSLAAWPVFPGL